MASFLRKHNVLDSTYCNNNGKLIKLNIRKTIGYFNDFTRFYSKCTKRWYSYGW